MDSRLRITEADHGTRLPLLYSAVNAQSDTTDILHANTNTVVPHTDQFVGVLEGIQLRIRRLENKVEEQEREIRSLKSVQYNAALPRKKARVDGEIRSHRPSVAYLAIYQTTTASQLRCPTLRGPPHQSHQLLLYMMYAAQALVIIPLWDRSSSSSLRCRLDIQLALPHGHLFSHTFRRTLLLDKLCGPQALQQSLTSRLPRLNPIAQLTPCNILGQ
ncbi:hypothetical protein PQX77_016464 [Marasmius sp. AFHP31]|nr:hypothetical protein PQX77_016464 [Marasmius sp. AFHP31]